MIAVESRIEAGADLAGLVREVSARVAASLDAAGLDLRFVVLDAGTGSQAWTEDVDGVPTSFLAAERFPAGDVGVCLLAHEAAHAVHHRLRPRPWPVTAATKLFEEALAIGLVNRIVQAPGLEAAKAYAREFSGHGLRALQFAREAVQRALDVPLNEGLRMEADLSTLAYRTADAEEGMQAFVEKRKAKFRDQ